MHGQSESGGPNGTRSNSIETRNRGNTELRASTTTRAAGDASAYLLKKTAPSYIIQGALADLYEVEWSEDRSSLSCYLWKRSKFYSKMPVRCIVNSSAAYAFVPPAPGGGRRVKTNILCVPACAG